MEEASRGTFSVYVNAPELVTEVTVRNLFEPIGFILGIRHLDKEGPRRVYFVEYSTEAKAMEAVERLNHYAILGGKMIVELTKQTAMRIKQAGDMGNNVKWFPNVCHWNQMKEDAVPIQDLPEDQRDVELVVSRSAFCQIQPPKTSTTPLDMLPYRSPTNKLEEDSASIISCGSVPEQLLSEDKCRVGQGVGRGRFRQQQFAEIKNTPRDIFLYHNYWNYEQHVHCIYQNFKFLLCSPVGEIWRQYKFRLDKALRKCEEMFDTLQGPRCDESNIMENEMFLFVEDSHAASKRLRRALVVYNCFARSSVHLIDEGTKIDLDTYSQLRYLPSEKVKLKLLNIPPLLEYCRLIWDENDREFLNRLRNEGELDAVALCCGPRIQCNMFEGSKLRPLRHIRLRPLQPPSLKQPLSPPSSQQQHRRVPSSSTLVQRDMKASTGTPAIGRLLYVDDPIGTLWDVIESNDNVVLDAYIVHISAEWLLYFQLRANAATWKKVNDTIAAAVRSRSSLDPSYRFQAGDWLLGKCNGIYCRGIVLRVNETVTAMDVCFVDFGHRLTLCIPHSLLWAIPPGLTRIPALAYCGRLAAGDGDDRASCDMPNIPTRKAMMLVRNRTCNVRVSRPSNQTDSNGDAIPLVDVAFLDNYASILDELNDDDCVDGHSPRTELEKE